VPLLVRADAINTPLLERAATLDELAERTIEQLESLPIPPQIGTAEVNAVGEPAVACYYLSVFGKQLSLRSEAAGIDYYLRSTHLMTRLRAVVAKWRARNFRGDDLVRLAKQVHDAGLTQLPALEARVQQGELEAVERVLHAILAEISRYSIWAEQEAGKYSLPFHSLLLNRIDKPLDELRRKRTADDLTAVLAQMTVNFDDLPARLAGATEGIRQSGTAAWEGENLTGPALIAKVGQQWQLTQVRAQRFVMTELARRVTHGPAPPAMEQVNVALAAYQEKLAKGLADLVRADATRVPPEGAVDLYERYLTELARLALLGDRARLQPILEPALAELAAKNPALKVEVDAYTLATSELLRWRRRVATASCRQRLKTSPTVSNLLQEVARRRNAAGLVNDEGVIAHAALLDAAPLVLARWRETALGRQTTATAVTGLGGGKSISRYDMRAYSRFTLPVSSALDNETRALKKSLLLAPGRRPLSFDATLAVVSAEEGCYPFVGGAVSECYLEPLLTRFMLLSDKSVGLLPLGTLPTEPVLFDLRPHVLARFDLTPSWVGHECFVVDLVQ
jgi:hypothetical protein